MILSIPEGDDKPLKYPLMFSVCDVLLLNKMDAAGIFDFSVPAVTERVHRLNPGMPVLPVSCKTGQGIEEWTKWLRSEIAGIRAGRGAA